MFRASAKMKNIPVFALCVKTALEDQARAQQTGFTGIITKPIEFEDLRAKVSRALHLDTSYRYFQQREGLLVLSLPASFGTQVANEISTHLRGKVAEAVDSGLTRMVIDLSQLKTGDVNVIKLCLTAIQLCDELSIKQRIIGSEAICEECKHYEETKDWRFAGSFEQAAAALKDAQVVAA
jgi:two-component system cell cycle response regulator